MFSRIKLFCLLVFVADLILLGVMVHYTSWLFMLGYVFISGLFGGWLLNNGLRRYVRKTGKSTNANEISAEAFLLGATARLAAGALFIVPGILTDLMALLLISPAGKHLVRIFIASLFGKMFPHPSNQDYFSDASGETPAKDEIIDVRIVNAGKEEPENGR
ncbi:MAG: FxsA family protein [Thermoguttaceae bacterium]|jgi:UPF0716 protein FxsA